MLNKSNKRATGSNCEDLACKLLSLNGYSLLEKNFRVRQGEIDIIARDGDYLCFIEVKARKDTSAGYPEEAVTYGKMQQIRKTALFYLNKNKLPENTPVRFDVIVILGNQYRIIKNAFDYS